MTISRADVGDIARNIWSTQLGLELEDCTVDWKAAIGSLKSESMTGAVQITGTWSGAVHIHCPRSVITKAARAIFGMEPHGLGIEDLRDTLGELTNMTAGNVKALLEGENHISLPTVVDGSDYDITLIGRAEAVDVAFLLDGQPLIVVVLEGKA